MSLPIKILLTLAAVIAFVVLMIFWGGSAVEIEDEREGWGRVITIYFKCDDRRGAITVPLSLWQGKAKLLARRGAIVVGFEQE